MGQVGVDAQGLNGLQVKELVGRTLIDQLAGIDIAGSDDAVEGRIDFFEGLEFLKALHVGLGGFDGGRSGGRGGIEGFCVLAGNGVGLDEVGVTICLNLRIAGAGLRGG